MKKEVWSRFGLLMGLTGWLLAAAGCASDSGSKEFIPGKGWRNTGKPVSPPIAQTQATQPGT